MRKVLPRPTRTAYLKVLPTRPIVSNAFQCLSNASPSPSNVGKVFIQCRMGESFGSVSWNHELENYFKDTGEKAHGRAWAHHEAHLLYSNRRTLIDLPVIIGSGVIAFLNAGSSTLWEDPRTSSVALGVGSLCVGLLNGIGTYFGWSKRAEGHRISALQYSRLYRFLRIQLGLPRNERMIPQDLLKYVKDSDDRLQETSPALPPIIIKEFRRRFDKLRHLSKPEEANGLEVIDIFQATPRLPRTESHLSSFQTDGERPDETPVVSVQQHPTHPLASNTASKPPKGPVQQSVEAETVLEPVGATIGLSTLNFEEAD